jgi:hypothetical protein
MSKRRAQHLIEFALVAVVVIPFIFACLAFLFVFVNAWFFNQATQNLGLRLTVNGVYDQDGYIAETGIWGDPVNPLEDTLTITVTRPNGTSTTYTWDDTVEVAYGDFVSIETTKRLRGGPFAQIVDRLGFGVLQASWTGIAQRNLAEGGDPNRPTTGDLTGSVRDAGTGNPIANATITLNPSGRSTVSAPNGRYVISNLEPGTYTATFEATGYQRAVSQVTIIAGTTTSQDALLARAAIIDVTVTRDTNGNLATNGGFETGSTTGWGLGVDGVAGNASNFTAAAPGRQSSYRGRFDKSGGGARGVSNTLTTTVVAGVPYRASLWVSASAGLSLTAWFGRTAADSAASTINALGSWQEVIVDYTPTASGTAVAGLYTATNATGISIDDLSVYRRDRLVSDALVTTSDGLTASNLGDGRYRLIVAPGTVAIEANVPGGDHGSAVVTISSGETQSVTIVVGP